MVFNNLLISKFQSLFSIFVFLYYLLGLHLQIQHHTQESTRWDAVF